MHLPRIFNVRLAFGGLAALCASLACAPQAISQPVAQRLLGAWNTHCTRVVTVRCIPAADETCGIDNVYGQCVGLDLGKCGNNGIDACQISGCARVPDEVCE